MNSAAEEILECGLHGLSISAVAARAEVAERTVYRYFESTETLLDALIQSVGARLGTLLGDQARLRPDRSSSLDELVAHLPALYVALDEIGAPARAVAASRWPAAPIRGGSSGVTCSPPRVRRPRAIRAILADLRAESTHNPAGVTQPGRA